MPPTIHLVRHAQGYHNISPDGAKMHDPDLTPLGQQQCAELRAAFPYHDDIERLVASPMRRTLETCILSFGHDDLYPIIALDCLQEVSNDPSDIGTAVCTLHREFGDRVDLTRVRDGWTDKGVRSIFQPLLEKLIARGREARRALREVVSLGGNGHTVVVLHGAFLHFLTDDWYGIPEHEFTAWSNCEYRSYQFADPSGADDDARLVETLDSWQRKCNEEKPSTCAQQGWRTVVHKRLAMVLRDKANTC
ncbi:phosphoglycerate mutase family protein [Xylogone sp. PMI_703]|nr:phosphoglycerate mutase family protein [Xylogone sp. PMI_703]